jgi:metallo-beta-lactamase family protein
LKVKFCGASRSVTGSCHLITRDSISFLLDCGQFQGSKVLEQENREPFLFEPSEVDFLVLSHAHIDHCGRIPLLVKNGFNGPIYCTQATADLLPIMLLDAAHIQEKEAEWQNKKAQRKGFPQITPLFTETDVNEALKFITPVLYDKLISPADGINIVFNEAGHILGSAIIEIFLNNPDSTYEKLVFTGDLGVYGRPILRDPKLIKKADYLIMESTYGNRLHEAGQDSLNKLADIIITTINSGGNVIIPSFAVGRTQELIYELSKAVKTNKTLKTILSKTKVYIDSPMAIKATEIFNENAQEFDEEARNVILSGENPLDFFNLVFTQTTEESKYINENDEPKIIIAASGMCEAGRIRHHLKHNLWKESSAIVFVGYQALGTLGRALLDGVESVKLFSEIINVKAKIHNLQGFSAHADKNGLLDFVKGFEKMPKCIYLVHGELEAKEALRDEIFRETGASPIVINDYCELEATTDVSLSEEGWQAKIDSSRLEELKLRLTKLEEEMEKILFTTQGRLYEEIDEKRYQEIEGIVSELEKSGIDLAKANIQN